MGVPGFRRPAILLIAAAAAMLLFMFSSGNKTTAVSFSPGYFAALSSTAPGANADITTIFSLPAPDSFPGGGVFAFTPPDWELAGLPPSSLGIGADLAIGDGSVVGSLLAVVDFAVPALGANACFVPAPIPFTLVDANADPSSTMIVSGSPNDRPTNIWAGFRAVPSAISGSNVPAAVTGWPSFLDPILAHLGGATPIARYYGQVNFVGELIALNLLLFSPGAIPGFDAVLGYVTVPILQDPLTPPAPSATGGVCTDPVGPFATTTIKGVTVGEPFLFPLPPCTSPTSCPAPGVAGFMFHPSVPPNLPFGEVCNGGDADGDGTTDEGCNQVNRTNPSAPGTYLFEVVAISDRDTDNDGIENPLDSCPLIVDAKSSGMHLPFPDGDGWNPRFPGPQPAESDNDGLPNSCDPNDNVTNSDEDSDFFSNLKDNCPSPLPVPAPIPGIPVIPIVSSNFSQAQAELGGPAPNDGGPISDGMGDPCDPNPTISDGHFHRAAAEGPVCLGLADDDFDGYCNADESALGSNPADAASTPEDISGLAPGLLALGKVCSDGIDNDNNGLKDLADPKCQLPLHDIRFGPPPLLFGPAAVTPSINPTVNYMFLVQNLSNPKTTETVQVGVLVNSLSGCGTAHVVGFSAFGAATIVSTDLGQGDGHLDAGGQPLLGQANFDSGGAPGGSGPFLSTATDLETEGFGLATLTVDPPPGPPGIVRFKVFFDDCGGIPKSENNFVLKVDICHSGDPAPLGLFSGFPPLGPFGAGCSGGNDGFQDRPPNNINDAPLSKLIDDTDCCGP